MQIQHFNIVKTLDKKMTMKISLIMDNPMNPLRKTLEG